MARILAWGASIWILALQGHTGAMAQVNTDHPKNWFAVLPDQRKWEKPDTYGRQRSILFGDPTKPGMYGMFVKWPPNATAKAHSHPDERYGFVVSGVFYHGRGDKFQTATLERRPEGTLFSEPAGVAHFGATKGEGTILYFVGIGPDRTDEIEH